MLSYRVVAKPIRLAKTSDGIGSSSIYNYGVANRLVLITCGYVRNGSSPFNWAVIAQFRSATAEHVVGSVSSGANGSPRRTSPRRGAAA